MCESQSVYEFEAEVRRWDGDAAWFFATLPEQIADDIEDDAPIRGGFGSVKVEVTVGSSTWSTSLFPSKQAASFVLPVKKAVRQREGLADGTLTTFALRLKI